jgi:positive regulator of sigma E activity
VPVVNAMTTNFGFFNALLSKNWVFVSVDLICTLVSIICIVLAIYLQKLFSKERKETKAVQQRVLRRTQA